MGWNDQDKDKDPRKGSGAPPDLDELLKKFQNKLKHSVFGNGNKRASAGDDNSNSNGGGGILAIIVIGIVIVLWALSGIFIVEPAEQAVITRFGKYVNTVGPGPHWIPRIINNKVVRNVENVMDYSYQSNMLTMDENLVSVAMVVQYRINDLEAYLFNVTDPQESLEQATSSALRQVVGTTSLDQLITEGREIWGASVQNSLIEILGTYKTGIQVVNVSPQPARAPENVQDAFDDAIKAQEDERRFKEHAGAYEAKVVPRATGQAKRVIEEAQAFAQQVVLRARGDVAEFLALLPEYRAAPKVTAERMYLESMQKVLQQSSKIVVSKQSGNLLYLPLDKMIQAKPPAKITGDENEENQDASSHSADDANLADSRQLVRKTYRPGRSN